MVCWNLFVSLELQMKPTFVNMSRISFLIRGKALLYLIKVWSGMLLQCCQTLCKPNSSAKAERFGCKHLPWRRKTHGFVKWKSCFIKEHYSTFHEPGWVSGRKITVVNKSLLPPGLHRDWSGIDLKYQLVINTMGKHGVIWEWRVERGFRL